MMKLKVALDYSMSVWMLSGVKKCKMTHWRGIYRQLTRIEPVGTYRQGYLLLECPGPWRLIIHNLPLAFWVARHITRA
jgi:hypothetical protein